MKKVVILSPDSRIPNFLIYPLLMNRRALRERGYEIVIVRKPGLDRLEADVFCIVSKFFQKEWNEPENIFAFLKQAKGRCGKLVWMDDSDSTGVTHFEILPLVDRYLKKQLFTDLSLYCKTIYSDRLFSDFYHERFGIDDPAPYQSKPLDLSLAHKVDLSWHIGLGDMVGDILSKPRKAARRLLPPGYPKDLTPPEAPRPLDVMFRGSRKYARPTISFHRERIGELLDAMTDLNAALTGFVSVKEYIRETRQSKAVVSPFGWGELGVRDFEAWLYGAALFKPDMSHMRTWPDIFIPGETYQPFSWGFEDFEERLRALLEDDALRLRIARNGQEAYRESVSPEGMRRFCDHFVTRMES